MRPFAPWIARAGSLLIVAGFFLPTFRGCGQDYSPIKIARQTAGEPKNTGEAVDTGIALVPCVGPFAAALVLGLAGFGRGRASNALKLAVFFVSTVALAVTGSMVAKATRGSGASYLWGSTLSAFLWFLLPVAGAAVVGAMMFGAAPLERCARVARVFLGLFLAAVFALLWIELAADPDLAPLPGLYVDLAGALALILGAALDRPVEAPWEPSSESSAASSS